MKFLWEDIINKYNFSRDGKSLKTSRAQVIGGWVLLHIQIQKVNGQIIKSESMTFIPDPEHKWVIE